MVILILAGGLYLVKWVAAEKATLDNAQKLVAQPSPTRVVPPVSQERLFDPNLDVASRAALSEKLEMQKRSEADRAFGANAPADKANLAALPNPGIKDMAAQPESGIFPGSDGMVRPEEADILNYWVGSQAGQALIVMAGSEPGAPERGLVIVMVNDGFSLTGYQRIAAPDGVQALKVIEQEGSLLVMEDSTMRQVRFDLTKLAFSP